MQFTKKPISLAVANLKGGVGKTTTVASLAYILGQKGYKVLAVDTDSQCNLTSLYKQDPDHIDKSIYEIMMEEANVNECIIKDLETNVDLLPGSPSASTLDMKLAAKLRKESLIDTAVKALEKEYDFIIYDTAPALNLLTMNVFITSDEIIIPAEADVFSLKAIYSMKETIDEVRKYHTLGILGILLTRVERLSGDKQIMDNSEQLAEIFETKTFKNYIKAQKNVKASRLESTNVVKYSEENRRKGHNDAGQDYERFADEMLKNLEVKYGNSTEQN